MKQNAFHNLFASIKANVFTFPSPGTPIPKDIALGTLCVISLFKVVVVVVCAPES